jgi:DNA-binding MarR family transcriptional regulator
MQDKIFLALLQTSGAHWEHARKGFQELGLSDGQPKVLYILKRSEGCVQKKLAQLCQIRESTMTVLLTKMEEKGYIYKETLRVSGGKRAYGIYLTEQGRELSDRLVELVDRLEELSFEGFSREEKEQLFSLLDRVKSNLTTP